MEKISQEKQKEIMLEILDYIHDVCMENKIEYSLSGGSLLGAIRHEGFIPWDDDIDIMLKRCDYEKLLAILRKSEEYRLLDFQVDNYKYMYAKLCDKKSRQISMYGEVPEFGLFVDIFPYDSLPVDDNEQKEFLKNIDRLNKELGLSSIKTYFHHQSYLKAIARMLVLFPKHLKLKKEKKMKLRSMELNNYMKQYNDLNNPYIGYVAWDYTEPYREKFPVQLFSEFKDYLFEGRYYRGIKDSHQYLTKLYGDYMELPPEDSRENHSYYRWYWRKKDIKKGVSVPDA